MCGMSQPSQSGRFPSFWVAWWVSLILIVEFEAARWVNPASRDEALTGWLSGREADWLPFLPIFFSGLVFWKVRGRDSIPQPACTDHSPLSTHLLSLLLGIFAVGVAAWTGWDMRDLPPAYHDEYSYLFQSLMFLDGRTSFPSFGPLPELFDQMHVLNEGRFASRYFPGAGFWFAIFHDLGSIWGLWIAHGIVTTGASIVAGEIGGRSARIIAGLAAATCPGLCLFSQLYLAHLPTLVGLSVFLVWMLRLRRLCEAGQRSSIGWGRWQQLEIYAASFFAGCGLSFAMLCRPMTAAGVGLPFGVWLFWWVARRVRGQRFEVSAEGRQEQAQHSPSDHSPLTTYHSLLPLLLCMAVPILSGIALQLAYNQSITGSISVSPYQLYTDIYTPRHVYGFQNVERGEQRLGPKVLDNYDRWAENLTLPLALRKMGIRIVASGRWTLGLVPLVFVCVLLVWNWRRWSTDLKLIVASIVSLHLVHLPYWFEGIMGWHYVFESAPLWAIVLGVVSADFAQRCRETGHVALRWWWGGVLLTSLAISWVTVPPLWPGRVVMGLAELRFPRQKYDRFDQLLMERIHGRAIVFIRPDPVDRHIDYIVNRPQLDAVLLRARAPETEAELQRAIHLFPDREPWLYDVKQDSLRLLRNPE